MGPEIGFETIGNATLICYDRGPVLVTDPWIKGSAYFGSWGLSHKIPDEQFEAATHARFVWFSHGHPDHLNHESLPLFRGREILLPNHYGGRIFRDLVQQGFQVRVLEDRKWYQLSDRVRVLCIADDIQDAILLVDLDGKLLININDCSPGGWMRFVRRTARRYRVSFLLALCCYGDADMINFFDESGKRILPAAARKNPLGVQIAQATEALEAKFFVPFSSFHRYQREDSVWAREYETKLADFSRGFHSDRCSLLPAFIRYDATKERHSELAPAENSREILPASDFGDNWSDCLEPEDVSSARSYFQSVEHLKESLDRVSLRVGGVEHVVELGKNRGRSITFEAPRGSLMTSIKYEIFDDMLIGNFMKTTLHGNWEGTQLWPHLGPFLTKYADNGRAKSREEVAAYLKSYRDRALDNRLELFERKVVRAAKALVPKGSMGFRVAKKAYWTLRRFTG